MEQEGDDSMAIRREDILRKNAVKKNDRRTLIRKLANKACDENDDALTRLSKN